MLTTLADAIGATQTQTTPSPIPARAAIFDSCPGDGNFKNAMNAFSAPIRNPYLKSMARGSVFVGLSLGWLYNFISRQADFFRRLQSQLLDPQVLSHRVPRTYIYSESDDIIAYRAVEEHAEAARKLGIDVRMEKYEDSSHVSHARKDPVRYWEAVKDAWTRSDVTST